MKMFVSMPILAACLGGLVMSAPQAFAEEAAEQNTEPKIDPKSAPQTEALQDEGAQAEQSQTETSQTEEPQTEGPLVEQPQTEQLQTEEPQPKQGWWRDSLRDEGGTLSFVLENDYFGDSDDNYTNGLRMVWLSDAKPRDPMSRAVSRMLGAEEESVVRRGVAIGQSIFTPRDIAETEYLPDQHPYGAWLYGEFTTLIERKNTVDQFTVQLGMVGPSAGGKYAQEEIHSAIDDQAPKGWQHQIQDEFGVVISYDKKTRALARAGSHDLGMDITPNFGVTVGNIYTNARAGLTVRIGQSLNDNDYGPPRVRPSLAGTGYFAPDDGFSWYVFGGVEGRAVAHDIFLDGSLFKDDDPHVEKEDFVVDLQAGLVLQMGKTQLGLTYVERTEEFETQGIPQRFGAVSLSRKL